MFWNSELKRGEKVGDKLKLNVGKYRLVELFFHHHTTKTWLAASSRYIDGYMYLGRGRPGWPAEPPAEPLAWSYGSSWCWGSDSWPCWAHRDWLSYRRIETVQKKIKIPLFWHFENPCSQMWNITPQCGWERNGAHLPWKSRLSSLQALMETSAEVECLFIISTRLTWRPLESSREHIVPASRADVHCTRQSHLNGSLCKRGFPTASRKLCWYLTQ